MQQRCTKIGASKVTAHRSLANRIRQTDQGVSVRNCYILRPANGRIRRWGDWRILSRAESRIFGGYLSRDGETCNPELAESSCSVGTCCVVDRANIPDLTV